jgi:hypothetical protein
MARTSTWTGWIVFGGWLMMIVGSVVFLEGLIAVIRDKYYVFQPGQLIILDVTKWGWLMMLWGIVLGLAGVGLAVGKGWARWFTIVVGGINFLVQLSFLGSFAYPLWGLTTLGLTAVVLYAVIVHWEAREPQY